MPELPEVEATVEYLRERVEGRTITASHVLWHRTVLPTDPNTFEMEVRNVRIAKVFRRGKYVGLALEAATPLFMFIHLRMSGSLDVIPTDFTLAKHDRISLELDNGKSIRFNDTRKFGRMTICRDPDEIVGHLGIEPLDPTFEAHHLHALLSQKKGHIKPVLLDQTVIAGLGNIYVDEVLWKTRTHPLTPANRLSLSDTKDLCSAIRTTLTEAIEKLGTDFGDGVVDGGMYRPRVYGREGKACNRCKTEIIRIVVGQRGTHLCPTCQKKPRKRATKPKESRTSLKKR